ncbi:MAG: DUF6036 family nucleotidyltransferase [Gemmatimonadota bacterium]
MKRSELEHAIRAACDVADETELWVFGSQAILGEHPGAPESLRQSAEVDVAPKNKPENVDLIDGALGELSLFHRTHGFYVHGLSVDAATLPDGWKDRTLEIDSPGMRPSKGYCLETHDLAASKLVAFREKDRDFVRTLLVEGLASAGRLLERISTLSVADADRLRLSRWVESTAAEL